MSNLALNKLPLEKDSWTRSEDATNGKVKGYTGMAGFAQAEYPCNYTIDLGSPVEIKNIRFLLWDGLGDKEIRNERKYRFSLSISDDNEKYEIVFSNENDEGDNGWYSFSFDMEKRSRYIKIKGISNDVNKWFHIVEFEVHDCVPPELNSESFHNVIVKDYDFKILKEEAEEEDLTEGKTHEKLAEMLYNLINNDEKGITIGLEGGWGSGKSTIINIFKNKIEGNSKILYFYFDAWAHEGDPLRRIFLESFINNVQSELKGCLKQLEEKKRKLSNREKHTKTKTTRTGTKFGIIIGTSSLFVPLGVAIVSGLVNQVTLKSTGETSLIFPLGVFLSLLPIIFVFLKAMKVWIDLSFKEIFNAKNWSFLNSNSDEDTTLETSEEEERSSIEFEKHFNEIIKIINKEKDNIKIVIVVDNLDRIDAESALKIWSTLQTFLQRNNPRNNSENNYEKIWIIVPYDEEGLKKLWEGEKENRPGNDEDCDICSKSFFDKCFQLRLEVPPMLISGWEDFFSNKMDEALLGWSQDDKKDALNVFRWTRDGINSPSPREIKTFINQLGFSRANTGQDISCRALAYFVVKKYINLKSKKDLLGDIALDKIPEEDLVSLMPKSIQKELSAILYGVSLEKGTEIMLSKMIDDCINSRNYKELANIEKVYGDTFWTVFDINMNSKMHEKSVMEYCHAIKNSFWKKGINNGRIEKFVKRLNQIVQIKKNEYPSKDVLEKYSSYFYIVDKSEGLYENVSKGNLREIGAMFFDSFISETEKKKEDEKFDYLHAGNVLIKLFQSVENVNDFSINWSEIGFDNLFEIIKENTSVLDYINTKDSNIIIDETVVAQISAKISLKTPFDGVLVELIDHFIKCGISKWDSVVDNLNVHFRQPTGININALNLFEKFVDSGKIQKAKLRGIMNDQVFWIGAYNNKNIFPSYKLSLLAARLFDGDLSKINFKPGPGQQAAYNFLETEVKNIWRSSDEKVLKNIWEEVKKLNGFSFLFNLAKDTSNKLTGKIIEKALIEKKKEVFGKFNFEDNFKPSFHHLFNDIEDDLAQFFIENSDIEQQLLEKSDIDLPKNSKEIYWLIKNSENNELIQKVVIEIEKINKERWIAIFENDTYECSILVDIFNKKRDVALENNYSDALIQIFNNLILSKKKPTTWQLENMEVLIKVMPKYFRDQFWNEVVETVKNLNFNIPDRFEDVVINGICKKKYLSREVLTIQTAIKKAADEKNPIILRFFHKLLEMDKKNYFVPENDFGKVLNSPLNKAYEGVENPEYKKDLEFIAEKFNVALDGEPEGEDGGSKENEK